MRRATYLAVSLVMLSAACVTTGRTAESTVIRAKDKVAPALVHIRPVKEVFRRGERREILVVGSGFIISPDGYVVTNEHVAGKSRIVRCVLSDKEEVDADVVGVDASTDIAVLKLRTARKNLPTVKLGASATLDPGQTVLALGSPHGLARSVSMGIVSVTDRYLGEGTEEEMPYNNWIQTDAAINPGNSGGPLVNLKGQVVGVNTRVLRGAENVGFAIPIDIAKEVIDQIISHGRVVRSWVGVTLQEMTQKTDDPTRKGVVIADVDPLSPAFTAGFRPGDIMLAIDGTPTNARFTEELPPVRKTIASLPVGKEVIVTIERGDRQLELPVRTVERSALIGEEVEFEEWGFTASELTPEVVRRAQLPSKQGVMVSGVQVGGIAGNAALRRGDIIVAVDGAPVEDLADFEQIHQELLESGERLILFDARRGPLNVFILLKQANGTNGEEPVSDLQGGSHGNE